MRAADAEAAEHSRARKADRVLALGVHDTAEGDETRRAGDAALAADVVGEGAEEHSAAEHAEENAGGEEGDGPLGEPKVALDVGGDEGDEEDLHAVGEEREADGEEEAQLEGPEADALDDGVDVEGRRGGHRVSVGAGQEGEWGIGSKETGEEGDKRKLGKMVVFS